LNHLKSSVDNDSADLPLAGIRVLDLTRALSGPFCTALLGDLGADVVKVESPRGELSRIWGPYQASESLYFVSANRNKRSLAMNIWSDGGRKVLQSMVEHFDVLVENFRPGVVDALGVGEDWLKANHPRVILASISGFGHVGPRSGEACFDQVAQGMGGLMSLTGTLDSGPMRSGIPLADNLSGMFAAMGICAALASRQRGLQVRTSLLESVIGVLTFQAQRFLSLGEVPERAGNDHPVTVPYGVFRTADYPINVAAGTATQWRALCEVIGAPELADDERLATEENRAMNRELVRGEIESRFVRRTAEEWLVALKAVHIPSGPINDMAATFAEPQVQALGMVQDAKHSALGTIPVVRGPLWFAGIPTPVRRAAPVLGEHTVEILTEVGCSAEEIDILIADGVISVAASSQSTESPTKATRGDS
jgi:crotonobetainyl-CoA:carnitine CoA-transferase CaiB-like acyl-CoA transferase